MAGALVAVDGIFGAPNDNELVAAPGTVAVCCAPNVVPIKNELVATPPAAIAILGAPNVIPPVATEAEPPPKMGFLAEPSLMPMLVAGVVLVSPPKMELNDAGAAVVVVPNVNPAKLVVAAAVAAEPNAGVTAVSTEVGALVADPKTDPEACSPPDVDPPDCVVATD